MVPASPTAEIGDDWLESSVGTLRVSGNDKKIQQNIKYDSQDENKQVQQAEVVGDEINAAIEEVIMSQDRGAITFEDVVVCGQEAHEWAASSGFGKKDQKPSPAQILHLICKKGDKTQWSKGKGRGY